MTHIHRPVSKVFRSLPRTQARAARAAPSLHPRGQACTRMPTKSNRNITNKARKHALKSRIQSIRLDVVSVLFWCVRARFSARALARASQVGLTCRPLRNDEKCGEGEDADLAAGHAGAAGARGRGVVPHGGSWSPVLQCQHWASPQSGLESRSWMAG